MNQERKRTQRIERIETQTSEIILGSTSTKELNEANNNKNHKHTDTQTHSHAEHPKTWEK